MSSESLFDDAAAEASFTIVYYDRLPRRDRPLRRDEGEARNIIVG